jgi:aldehyde:ferredoxin oxidoreductase
LLKFDAMLDRYYQLRGWDADGRPTNATLARLGLREEGAGIV